MVMVKKPFLYLSMLSVGLVTINGCSLTGGGNEPIGGISKTGFPAEQGLSRSQGRRLPYQSARNKGRPQISIPPAHSPVPVGRYTAEQKHSQSGTGREQLDHGHPPDRSQPIAKRGPTGQSISLLNLETASNNQNGYARTRGQGVSEEAPPLKSISLLKPSEIEAANRESRKLRYQPSDTVQAQVTEPPELPLPSLPGKKPLATTEPTEQLKQSRPRYRSLLQPAEQMNLPPPPSVPGAAPTAPGSTVPQATVIEIAPVPKQKRKRIRGLPNAAFSPLPAAPVKKEISPPPPAPAIPMGEVPTPMPKVKDLAGEGEDQIPPPPPPPGFSE